MHITESCAVHLVFSMLRQIPSVQPADWRAVVAGAGDYWPGEAENALANINEADRKAGKKAKSKAGGAPRPKAYSKGKRYGAEPASADQALMSRLGEVIHTMREDFIVVHLQENCCMCRSYISEGPKCAPTGLHLPAAQPECRALSAAMCLIDCKGLALAWMQSHGRISLLPGMHMGSNRVA